MKFSSGFLLLCCLSLLGCGSNNHDAAEDRLVRVRFDEPAFLDMIQPEDQEVSLHMIQLTKGEEGEEVALALSKTDDVFLGTLHDFAPGRYLARVQIVFVTQDNASKSNEEAHPPLALAKYEYATDVVVGQTEIILDIAAKDFSSEIDDDGDGAFNLAELLGETNPYVGDTDGDGVQDGADAFPNAASEFKDTDNDGVGDKLDNCRTKANSEQEDIDEDGFGDACDEDSDNDGLLDAEEEVIGSDLLLADTDHDGVLDPDDNCPLLRNTDLLDTDGDGLGNACDGDDDNDGIVDVDDNCPYFSSQDTRDTNGDGVGDACIQDDDGDGTSDGEDNCPALFNPEQRDNDEDGLGDLCDSDDDNDGLPDEEENTAGRDNLITGSFSRDTDSDGVLDNIDNCPLTTNRVPQVDNDGDGDGDACDCDSFDAQMKTANGIFVSPSGNDHNSGARNQPVRSIAVAQQRAVERHFSRIYVVTGTYNAAVEMQPGISLFGGFALSNNGAFCQRQFTSNGQDVNLTEIIAATSPVVSFIDIDEDTILDGFLIRSMAATPTVRLVDIEGSENPSQNFITLRNSYLLASSNGQGSTIVVDIHNASPRLINNVIFGGSSRTTLAVNMLDSPATKLLHNTISGGVAFDSATALQSFRSSPTISNNIAFTEAGSTQTVIRFLDEQPSNSTFIQNNLLFGIQSVGSDQPKIYFDFHPSFNHVYESVAQLNAVGPRFQMNYAFSSPLNSLLQESNLDHRNWRLRAGTAAENHGVNTTNLYGIEISDDHDMRDRSEDSPDLGAFER